MTAQISKNPNLLKLLEWDSIVSLISNHSHFSNTVTHRILNINDLNSASKSIYHTQVFLDNYYSDTFTDIRNSLQNLDIEESFSEFLKKIKKDGFLTLKELNQVIKLIEFHFNSFKDLKVLDYKIEDNFNINSHKAILDKKLVKDFRSFYSEDDSYNYLNHPRLSKIYKQILDKENHIRKSINDILSRLSDKVQYSSYDVINDRYVIPVKTDSFTSTLGQIISRSDSGQTLFIEPSSLKGHNYQRIELMVQLDKEINSLAINYCNIIKSDLSYIFKIQDLVFYLDTYFTRSSFAHINNYVLPIIGNTFNIKQAFHPLIENCIKNDFFLSKEKGIIISGPNTGGKTATLKTLTLIMLFSKFGLASPASHAEVPFYEDIFYFGNDQQNINEGLSSFAGEVKSYNSMLNALSKKSLIVIDEIFNSTSSEEASALAIGLFEQIHNRADAHILVSTHHQMLKSVVHSKDEYISAHVGFDVDTGKPTYKVNFGTPGASQALSIFKKLSHDQIFTDDILKKASTLLDKKMISYETLLEKISKKENELLRLEKENREINIQLKNQKASMEGILQLKLQDKLDSADQKVKSIFDKAQAILSDVKKGNLTSKKSLLNSEAELKSKLNNERPKNKQPASQEDIYKDLKIPKDFIIGQKYFSIELKQTITLKSIDSKRRNAKVTKGALTINCPVKGLRVSNANPAPNDSSGVNSFRTDSNAKIEHDCRGMRLEEFQSLIERISGELISQVVPFVNIIHGHGTGVLKSWLRKFIKNHKDLEFIKDTTGNDGETRFTLKT